MFSTAILSFDMKFPDSKPAGLLSGDVRLDSFLQICRRLVAIYYHFENHEKDRKTFANSPSRVASQFVLFFEFLHTLPLWIQQYVIQKSTNELVELEETTQSSSQSWKDKVEKLKKNRTKLLPPSLKAFVKRDDFKPSETHLLFEKEMLYNFINFFPKEGKHFTIKNEFCGLHYPIYPIDIAVLYKEELVAFIEVHGFGHKSLNPFIHINPTKAVSRSDLLKKSLYSYHYPEVLYLTAEYINFTKDPEHAKKVSKDMTKEIVAFLVRRVRDHGIKDHTEPPQ
jgi:hypothetical protein